ncbi:MAG: hypothetical protein AUK16_03155 [Parcubacteria group bacterium CG2_30_44_11]|nr:MAG: hypothetical protein AUK16_03155 [Parcubacteria group bacterium CG2_30_44_11]
MSIKTSQLTKNQRGIILKALYSTVEHLEQPGSATVFINTFLTDSEKIKLGRRILIAQMILSGYPQPEIRYQLRISPNTFTKTRKWLESQIPDYATALKEFENKPKKYSQPADTRYRFHYDPFTFQGMRTRYPMHFLFFTLAESLLTKWRR